MRSDRYKKSDYKSTMADEDRHDFWSGAALGEHADKPDSGETIGDFFKNLLVDIVIAAVLAGAVLYFIRPTIVKQTSMEDTLYENDYMIMYKRAYTKHGPERGDIVIFQSELTDEESGKDKLLIKRVIGLPGDKISIKDGEVYINGEVYNENYTKDGFTPAFDTPKEGETYTVPKDSYFCMGDNRVASIDSRRTSVGCVSKDLIRGKVVLRLYPFNKIKKF